MELLVVVGIIGVLMAISAPALQQIRESSRRTACTMHLQQLGVALHAHHTALGAFPIGSKGGTELNHNWMVPLLDFLDRHWLFANYRFDRPSRSAENHEVTKIPIDAYLCPSTARVATDREGAFVVDIPGSDHSPSAGMACTDYGGVFGDSRALRFGGNGMLIWDRPVKLKDVRDGLACTLFVAEANGRGAKLGGEWANGDNLMDITQKINTYSAQQTGPAYDNEIWSDHPGGANVLSVDGSTHFLRETLDATVLGALATRAGAELDANNRPYRIPND